MAWVHFCIVLYPSEIDTFALYTGLSPYCTITILFSLQAGHPLDRPGPKRNRSLDRSNEQLANLHVQRNAGLGGSHYGINR